MRFIVGSPPDGHARQAGKRRGGIYLTPLEWDDYGYRTSYRATLVGTDQAKDLGVWKIAQLDGQPTQLRPTFEALPPNFVSMGQQLRHYNELEQKLGILRPEFLRALRDLTVIELSQKLLKQRVVKSSLLRSRGAQAALAAFRPSNGQTPARVDFVLRTKIPHLGLLEVDFPFSNVNFELSRAVMLVGRNGAGKTSLLSSLALVLSGLGRIEGECVPPPAFAGVLAVSFSVYDQFVRPGEQRLFPYLYRGLRPPGESSTPNLQFAISIAELDRRAITQEPTKHQMWRSGLVELEVPHRVLHSKKRFQEVFGTLSAGEQAVVFLVTSIIANIQRGSLILLDEPELHLHPKLLLGLLRWLQDVLVAYEAFAVVATQSAVPLQESLARSVRVVTAVDGTPFVRKLRQECFGEPLDRIVEDVFGVTPDEDNSQRIVQRLKQTGATRDQLQEAFGGARSFGVRSLLDLVFAEG